MLPGIRFLCAAVVLTVSLMVFGLGAVALLRSAHQEFASIPTRRAPQTAFAAPGPEAPPTLAMLRLDERTPETTVTADAVAPAPRGEAFPLQTPPAALVAAAPAEPAPALEPAALLGPTPQPAPEQTTARADVAAVPEPAPVVVAAAPPAAMPPVAPLPVAMPPAVAPAADPSTAVDMTITGSLPAPDVAAADATDTTATLTSDDVQLSSSRIAMLGGPPIDTEPVPLPSARPAQTVERPVRKIVRSVKKTPVKKRRVAARRPAATTAAATAPADPFGQPFPTAR